MVHNSLKNKIIIYFSILFILLMTVFSLVTFIYFRNIIKNEVIDYSEKILEKTRINIDSYFEQLSTIFRFIAINENVINGLKSSENKNIKIDFYNKQNITVFLQDILRLYSDIKDIILIKKNGLVFYETDYGIKEYYNFNNQPWFPLNKRLKVSYIGLHKHDYYYNKDALEKDSVFSAIIPVIDVLGGNSKIIGNILINISKYHIDRITEETVFEKSGGLLVVDDNLNFIGNSINITFKNDISNISDSMTSTSGNFIYKINNRSNLIVYKKSKMTNWGIIAFVPLREIYHHVDQFGKFFFFAILFCIITIIFISVIISNKITHPLSLLVRKLERIENEHFEIDKTEENVDEINILSNKIENLIKRIVFLNRNIYLYEISNREARIQSLIKQINPHFLYNTLQAIKSMVINNKNQEVSKMVTQLGKMLRYSTYHLEELSTVEQELKHAEAYLKIYDLRYPGWINYSMSCPEKLYKCKTLKLILQPIIENAIVHGLKDVEIAKIELNVSHDDEGITFTITDNGIGMSEDRQRKIYKNMESIQLENSKENIGLQNVHSRIRLMFGNDFGITISSKLYQGTKVSLRIPFITSDSLFNKEKAYID